MKRLNVEKIVAIYNNTCVVLCGVREIIAAHTTVYVVNCIISSDNYHRHAGSTLSHFRHSVRFFERPAW